MKIGKDDPAKKLARLARRLRRIGHVGYAILAEQSAAEIRKLRARVAELEGDQGEALTRWPTTEPAPIPIPGDRP